MESESFALIQPFPSQGNHYYPVSVYFSRDILCIHKHRYTLYMVTYPGVCMHLHFVLFYALYTVLHLSPLTLFDNCPISTDPH